MFDKWKSKNALCKAYKLYYKKKMLYLKADTIDLYQQLEDIQYAIAYVLCEYFNFKCDNPFSYKWYITYDYTNSYNQCKEAYKKIVKENRTKYNNIVWSINDLIYNKNKGDYSKGDIIYNMESGCLYFYDGNNLKNMC